MNQDLSTEELLKKVNINHSTDERTVIIGKNTPQSERATPAEAKRMLEQTLDTTKDPAQKAVYEKIYKGVTRG